jgi:hypothetical protein
MRIDLFLKSIIFWDMTPCSLSSFNRRFGGSFRLHLQGRRNKFKNQQASKQVASCLVWRWRRYVPPKRRLKLDRLHGVISQKMILFITNDAKTSNPTDLFMFKILAWELWKLIEDIEGWDSETLLGNTPSNFLVLSQTLSIKWHTLDAHLLSIRQIPSHA